MTNTIKKKSGTEKVKDVNDDRYACRTIPSSVVRARVVLRISRLAIFGNETV